jgi:hypothetical protein
MGSDFELLGELTAIEIIAVNLSIRERQQLRSVRQSSMAPARWARAFPQWGDTLG